MIVSGLHCNFVSSPDFIDMCCADYNIVSFLGKKNATS